MDPVGRHAGLMDQVGVLVDDREGPAQGIRVELPGLVDALAEADDLGTPFEIDETGFVLGAVGDQQPE